MTVAEPVVAGGLSDELGPVDYLLHRGEANPRTRSGIMALELLDTTPDWDRFRTRFENASRKVLRLRQKVVVPTLPTAAPRWVVDPDFNLDFHVRRVRVSEPGTLREVFDLAELILQSPLDISRPLWTATLVEGLADGKAATLLHVSHAVTDGVGGVEMFAEIYDLERDPPARPTPPLPIPQDLSPNDLMRQGINHLPMAIVGGALGAVSGAVSAAGRAVLEPVSTVSGIVGYARLGRAGDQPRRRAVAAAAPAQPGHPHRSDRHPALRPAQGRKSRRRIDQRRLSRRSVRRPAALPRGPRCADQHAADGGPGEPAGRRRYRRRQPVHRRQPGGTDGHRRPGLPDEEDPGADDPAP